MEGDAPIEVNVQLVDADLRAFHARTLLVGRTFWWVCAAGGAIGSALYLVQGMAYVRSHAALLGGMVLATIVSVFFALQPTMLARQDAGIVEKFSASRYVLRADEIEVHAPRGSVRHAWSDFERVLETPDAFYLFVAKRHAYILPKRTIDPAAHGPVASRLRAAVGTYDVKT